MMEEKWQRALDRSKEEASSTRPPKPALGSGAATSLLTRMATLKTLLYGSLAWLKQRAKSQPAKQLRVSETVSLGDRKFLALVQVDQERFLIGGSANSVGMLARLKDYGTFAEQMKPYQMNGIEN